MTDWTGIQPLEVTPSRRRLVLIILLCAHIVVCCVSLVHVADFYDGYKIIWFDKARTLDAALTVGPFAMVAALFALARFSFGYFVGFYFYTMILGYLWIVGFSHLHYDHTTAAVSAFVSAVALLLPALFITSPIRQRPTLSTRALDVLLSFILVLAAVIVAVGAFYNFRLVGVADIYGFRDEIDFPAWLRYLIGTTSNALLPFAFACLAVRGNRLRATAALLLLLLFYPITLTKQTLFAPFWLVFLFLLTRFFTARTSVVLSLFLPVSAGVILAPLVKSGALPYQQFIIYFGTVNFRMIAIPSIALDTYSDFFSTHSLTHFCQISFLKLFVDCPYSEYLSVVMAKAYQIGNLNGSLFTTEGIASVGPLFAPLAVFACGLVISLANRLSSSLPPRIILLSSGLLSQTFLNVPLATNLLTNGAALLFLLWYVTPREMFEPGQPVHPSIDDGARR